MESPPKGHADGTLGQAAPERLGPYPLLGVIGKGSMGIVYKSFDARRNRPIALKTIRHELLDDEMENFPASLRVEADAAGGLDHPGIVSVYEHGEAEGHAYIAMEYVEGHSLRECFERRVHFNIDQAIDIVAQLLNVLHYAHGRGVWHRDVKPANILLRSDGRIKVTDFGIARVESAAVSHAAPILGTPGFIAPELYLGEEFDHRIDLFAAGVVLYQFLTGVAPFVGSAEKVMLRVCYETPLPPSIIARQPALRAFDAVVLKALARAPQDRYSSATEFLDALVLARAGGPADADETVILSRRGGAVPERPVDRPASRAVERPAPPEPACEPTPEPQLEPMREVRPRAWNAGELARIEQQLARFVGPIARVWVRAAAQESADVVTLIQWVAQKMKNPLEREAFLRGAGVLPVSTTPPAPAADDKEVGAARTAPGRALTPEYIARASQLLAVHLGPIASVLARRAAQSGSSQEQFVATLAAHLNDERDRTRFLRSIV